MRLITMTIALLAPLSALASGHVDPREVFGRLVAPCCWNQTLDVHDSELASALRVEIADRLERGQTALGIEDDMARRYGERVRAVPRGRDPRQAVGLGALGAMLAALLGLVVVARRWAALRTPSAPTRAAEVLARDDYDERLDRELGVRH